MKHLDEPTSIRQITAANSDAIEADIERSWDIICAHATDAQVRWITSQEAEWGDVVHDDPVTRWTFMHFLRCMARNPGRIGVNLNRDGDAPYNCRCEDVGWYDSEKGYVPCERCNRQMYELWSAGCLRPDHTCERCAPNQRRRARGTSHVDEVRAQTVEETSARVDADLFGDGSF